MLSKKNAIGRISAILFGLFTATTSFCFAAEDPCSKILQPIKIPSAKNKYVRPASTFSEFEDQIESLEAFVSGRPLKGKFKFFDIEDAMELAQRDLAMFDYGKFANQTPRIRLERIFLALIPKHIAQRIEEGLLYAKGNFQESWRQRQNLDNSVRYLGPLVLNYGRVETDYIRHMIIEVAPKYPDLQDAIEHSLETLRPAYFRMHESLVSPTSWLTLEKRIELLNIPLKPDRADLERRIEATEEAMKHGEYRFARDVLGLLRTIFEYYRTARSVLEMLPPSKPTSLDAFYSKLRGPQLERLGRIEAEELLDHVESLYSELQSTIQRSRASFKRK